MLTAQAERDSVGALRGASYEEVRAKYLDTATVSLTPENSAATLDMLDNLEDIGSVGRLADLLSG